MLKAPFNRAITTSSSDAHIVSLKIDGGQISSVTPKSSSFRMRILPNLSVLKDSVLSTNFLPCLTYFYLSRLYATLGFTVTVGDLSSASRRP